MFPELGRQYKFIKEVGSGGTGVVNLAIDTYSGYPVAIKSLYKELNSNKEVFDKFQKEANIYLMLSHPNIVKLKDYILNESGAHLVMDFIEGKTLDQYINTVTGPMPGSVAINILENIVGAIGYAHSRSIAIKGYNGVLHLDIKPNNILITKENKAMVIDYGISQGTEEERILKMGTPLYMAPEQLDLNKKLDQKTDIYALGLVIHQMLSGENPYNGDYTTKEELDDCIMKYPLTKIKDLYPGFQNPSDYRFQEIVDKATSKNPEDRYQSCEELLSNLISIKDEIC